MYIYRLFTVYIHVVRIFMILRDVYIGVFRVQWNLFFTASLLRDHLQQKIICSDYCGDFLVYLVGNIFSNRLNSDFM